MRSRICTLGTVLAASAAILAPMPAHADGWMLINNGDLNTQQYACAVRAGTTTTIRMYGVDDVGENRYWITVYRDSNGKAIAGTSAKSDDVTFVTGVVSFDLPRVKKVTVIAGINADTMAPLARSTLNVDALAACSA